MPEKHTKPSFLSGKNTRPVKNRVDVRVLKLWTK